MSTIGSFNGRIVIAPNDQLKNFIHELNYIAMEEELRCYACKHFFEKPVLLPCGHSLCLSCALGLQQSAGTSEADSVASSNSGDYQESDKLSIVSETDSGVVCGSRPGSYVGSTNNSNGTIFPTTALYLSCPICQKLVYFDENGANNLPGYKVMQSIIEKYKDMNGKNEHVENCQMCEETNPKLAIVRCEQCSILYCETCKETCHPARGPLARHLLLPAGQKNLITTCVDHGNTPLVAHCIPCRQAACERCLQERHPSHEVQPLSLACKSQKTELSQNLQLLSEKALALTEYIQRVKKLSEKVNDSYNEFENIISSQCDILIEAIKERKKSLIDCIRSDRDNRVQTLKEQSNTCTKYLQNATGLLQFCIEALKETDSAAFLQVGWVLAGRAATVGVTCARALQSAPRPPPPAPDLTLDDRPVLNAIHHLNFMQMKPPGAPGLAPESCAAENNSVTVAWTAPLHSHIEGYVLELDDGHGGDFREVYCGKELMCTVDGLHFNSLYNARVKAFNATGEGMYSELIGLQTAPVAWFCWEGGGRPDGLALYGQGLGARVAGWEHRVALAGVGLSRGLHYWQLRVDRYDTDTDPAFGVARADVARDKMLGKDGNGWAMYIDGTRSWFQHGGAHHSRQVGGIQTGSIVGVLLDLDAHTLRFTVDGHPQGSIAFTDLYGVFYPAVSLNRGVAVTLCPALDPPSDIDD